MLPRKNKDKIVRRSLLVTLSCGILVYLFHPRGVIFGSLLNKAPHMATQLEGAGGILIGLSFLVVLIIVLKLEKPSNWREFLQIKPPSIKQMLVYLFLSNAAFFANYLVLDALLWEPVQKFLEGLGLHGEQVGGSWSVPEMTIDGRTALFMLAGLLLISWIEVPEEILFRGYIQNHLQQRFGPVVAIIIATFLWDLMHLFALSNFLERYYLGFITSGIIFMIYRNTTTPAIMHPLDNRAGFFVLSLAPLFGINMTSPFMYWLATNIFIIGAISLIMVCYRLLKLIE